MVGWHGVRVDDDLSRLHYELRGGGVYQVNVGSLVEKAVYHGKLVDHVPTPYQGICTGLPC